MIKNKSLVFNSIPQGYPVPGKDLIVNESEFDLGACPEGGIITKNLFVSLDPYQRGRMRDPSTKSYSPAYPVGSVISNGGVAEVVKSSNPKFSRGDIVTGLIGTERYSAVPKQLADTFRKLENPYNLPLSNFTGILGMPGLTAYSSFYKIGQPKKGETIFVSAASGAVGAVVGQLAKREGLRVIGSVGSDEKADYIKSIGFDEAFNYKTVNPHEALAKLAPQGIDIYFDNVGGIQLEAAIGAANDHARFIECGMISYYNAKSSNEMHLPSNIMNIVSKRLLVQGFIVGDQGFGPAYAEEFQTNVSRWLAEGQFKAQEHIVQGVDNSAQGLVGMLQGKNFGKALVKIDHDEVTNAERAYI